MANKVIAIGAILVNRIQQYTKVISYRNGRYGLSGWSNLESAKKSNMATLHLNEFGLQYASARVVNATGKSTAPVEEADETNQEQDTMPVENESTVTTTLKPGVAKKAARKSAAKKVVGKTKTKKTATK